MTPRTQSIAIVVGTLIIGIVLGGVIVGAISQKRSRAMRDAGRPGGFVRGIEDLIQPRDSAQRAEIRPLLERTDQRNRHIVDGARKQLQMAFDTMMTELAPHLSEDQMGRLRQELQRHENERRPPPGLGPPPSGTPPPGAPPPGSPPDAPPDAPGE